MKNIIKQYILPVLMVLGIIFIWISANFLKESTQTLSGIFEKKLPFKINPLKYGGEIIAVIDDDINDNLVYELPENQIYKNTYKLTDLISYQVHSPIADIEHKNTWNIDLYFHSMQFNDRNPNGFDLIKGKIYIDINDSEQTEINLEKNKNIILPSNFHRDYTIDFDYTHKEGILYSAYSGLDYPVKITVFKDKNSIRLGIPIVEKLNKKMDKNYMGRHIVLTGYYSQLDNDHFIHSNNITPYYDMISASDKIIEKKLFLEPVTISNYKNVPVFTNLAEITEKLTKLTEEEYNSYYTINNKDINKAVSLYKNNKFKQAEIILIKYLDYSSMANTYMGVINALKARDDKTGLSDKIKFVNSAYDYFDTAESKIKNDNDLYILLTNRIGVSISVPDEIFNKLDTAENDIKKLLEMNLPYPEKSKYFLYLINIYNEKEKYQKLRILLHNINKELEFIELIN